MQNKIKHSEVESPALNSRLSTPNSPKAFTLVELLVVITIIGILASLITVGVRGAVGATNRAKITAELSQITNALERYRSVHGEYPPDLRDKQAVLRHIKKRWPRFTLSGTPPNGGGQYEAFIIALNNVYKSPELTAILASAQPDLPAATGLTFFDNPTNMRGESNHIGSLALWLGGFPNADGNFAGFSSDEQAPFGRSVSSGINNGSVVLADVSIGAQDNKNVFMELVIGKNVRYVQTSNTPSLTFPCIVNSTGVDFAVPYVYFRPNSGGGPNAYTYVDADDNNNVKIVEYTFNAAFTDAWAGLGEAVPYVKSGDPFKGTNATRAIWFGADTFQLIHPGFDGVFGKTDAGSSSNTAPFQEERFRSIISDATDNNIGKADNDNLANFSEGRDIKSLID